jgi:hypothetical protein
VSLEAGAWSAGAAGILAGRRAWRWVRDGDGWLGARAHAWAQAIGVGSSGGDHDQRDGCSSGTYRQAVEGDVLWALAAPGGSSHGVQLWSASGAATGWQTRVDWWRTVV